MAKLLNRKYIGSEISKDYCDIAEQRILMKKIKIKIKIKKQYNIKPNGLDRWL